MTEVTELQGWILLCMPLAGMVALLVWIVASWVGEYRRKENGIK